MDVVKEMKKKGETVRVFGYGSLLWKPECQYTRKVVGRIEGYKRRFWQGNVTHRGTEENIGRVATLVRSKKGEVWGVMYELEDEGAKEKALECLNNREVVLGGYDVVATTFYPRDTDDKPYTVIVFMATKQNEYYIGKASIKTMAMQIVNAVGPCGTNIEYVTKMADYIREHIPEDDDEHLFALDRHVREICDERARLDKSLGQSELIVKRGERSS